MPQLFLDPNMCGFQYTWRIPDPRGQLAELIVYIISTRAGLYTRQIILLGHIALSESSVPPFTNVD